MENVMFGGGIYLVFTALNAMFSEKELLKEYPPYKFIIVFELILGIGLIGMRLV